MVALSVLGHARCCFLRINIRLSLLFQHSPCSTKTSVTGSGHSTAISETMFPIPLIPLGMALIHMDNGSPACNFLYWQMDFSTLNEHGAIILLSNNITT